ncbi:hypothetical protein FRB94_007615 [Tulasnella sp. JGI-2019a]|nr:hypothetical protein FRB94_007615 [Tulasnella sp. JGI-2019a]
MRPFETRPDPVERSPDTQMRLQEYQGMLEKIKGEIKTLMLQRLGSRILNYDSDASKLVGMKQSVDEAMNQLQGLNRLAAQQQLLVVRQPDMSHEERLDEATNLLISQLGNVDPGVEKKPPCVAGTREHILGRIEEWIGDTSSGSKHCYLLLGPAGTGKSAIASSIANRRMASRRLGAVFHFTRDEQTRNKGSILALAGQLARCADRGLRSKIASAIESARKEGLDIARMGPENQFQQLIEEPMRSLSGACHHSRRAGRMLFDKLPDNVKLFITSRGELQLQQCYNSEPLKSQLETHFLGDERTEQVEGDISVYFKQEFPVLLGHLVTKPSDWLGEERR